MSPHLLAGGRLAALLAALLLAGPAPAQDALGGPGQPTDDPRTLASRPAQWRLNGERVRLPDGEHLGLIGTSYLLGLGQGWWIGPAAYGAITGQRGGLFTVGAELAWQRPLWGPWDLQLGLYAGGGGGGSAPVAGGLMLRPHADLRYALGDGTHLGLSVARLRFAGSPIDSTQLGLVWSVDTDFRYVPSTRLDRALDWATRSGVGFDRVQAVGGFYRPRAGARRASGGALPSTIGYAGARLEQALGDRGGYWGLEANGAASGGVAGYAEYLATLGAEASWGTRNAIGARLALGMGGGGDVDVGGGLLWKAGAYGIVRVAGDLGVTFEAGLVRAPQGSFSARYGAFALNWVLDERGGAPGVPRTTRTEWVGGVERYQAARRDGSTRTLDAVALRVNRYLSDEIYLSGQAHSAYAGGAGGYSVGLLGLGWQKALAPRWHAGVEALAGAAGGGGVDTAGGLIAQPMAYVGYELAPGLALRVGGGRLQALRGPLKSDVVELSLAFTFGVTNRGPR